MISTHLFESVLVIYAAVTARLSTSTAAQIKNHSY
jgi:hypothetical protein